MPSDADRQIVVGEFDSALYPGGQATLDTAWLGIYQTLWWFHDPTADLRELLPDPPARILAAMDEIEAYLAEQRSTSLHIREANDLKKERWAAQAAKAQAYIAAQLGIEPDDLPPRLDRMMRNPRWLGKQRNNPLGNGLRILVAECLRRWGDRSYDYKEERRARDWFPGIQLPGRSNRASMDVSATRDDRPRSIASCKWSIRHDRISDPTNECQEYKAAAVRRQIMDLQYVVITNELDVQRLDKVINQPCVDALVHVHLPLVLELSQPSVEMRQAITRGRLLDLTEWIGQTRNWA